MSLPCPAADATIATAATLSLPDAARTHAAAPAATVPAERGECWLTLPLRHAGATAVCVRYECLGPTTAPVVAVLGGISASRHLAASRRFPERGWWSAQAAAGGALDPSRHCLVSIDWLGADGAIDASIDTADQADALVAVLDALRIRRLRAVVGASYGAMVGLQFAARHGERLERLIAISGAHRAHAYATALRCVQRAIVRLAEAGAEPRAALAVARQLALIGYRSPAAFAQRFDAAPASTPAGFMFPAEAYLHARGDDFAARFTPAGYLRLSESLDLHRVDPAQIRTPVTLIGVDDDQLVPMTDLYALAERLAGPVRVHALRSAHGHDAFLKEADAIGSILRESLARGALEVAA